jgi:hypothetical protein
MAIERRRKEILLGVAVVLLAAVAYYFLPATTSTSAGSTPSAAGRTRGTSSARATPAQTAPEVHLYELDERRPEPIARERDLFRFKPKPAPPPPPAVAPASRPPSTPVPTGPPPPPPLPPIGYKFIGLVETPVQASKIAILSDKDHNVFHGREGDIIEGRFRILRIGAESIEMAYLDGRGRQTIRLTGS